MKISSRPFGSTAAGAAVSCYDLENKNGMTVSVLDYGCTIQRILVPSQRGEVVDVVLGYDSIDGYEQGNCFFGALVGRFANRIRNAQFCLNGQSVQLHPNHGAHHLHGVFSKTRFEAAAQSDVLTLRHVSAPEEEGYPGTLSVLVRYSLTEENALVMEYEAEADADTIVNLTNHTYFNLNGSGDVLKHTLMLRSDRFAECDAELLPTGKLLRVEGTPMDFRAPRIVGEVMDFSYPQLKTGCGYDHHYVLENGQDQLYPFAELTGDQSGIRMTAETTQPGVQLYTANFVQDDTAQFGKAGKRYEKHAGLCLETQHAPDSPNLSVFPSAVLCAGERYYQKTVYRFHR